MVGFHAVGDPEQEFSFNDGEIAEAGWFTRAEVRDGARGRRLEQRLAVAAAVAGIDLDRQGDHRILGGVDSTRTAEVIWRQLGLDLCAARVGQR